jgi:hypothetical protein
MYMPYTLSVLGRILFVVQIGALCAGAVEHVAALENYVREITSISDMVVKCSRPEGLEVVFSPLANTLSTQLRAIDILIKPPDYGFYFKNDLLKLKNSAELENYFLQKMSFQDQDPKSKMYIYKPAAKSLTKRHPLFEAALKDRSVFTVKGQQELKEFDQKIAQLWLLVQDWKSLDLSIEGVH